MLERVESENNNNFEIKFLHFMESPLSSYQFIWPNSTCPCVKCMILNNSVDPRINSSFSNLMLS